MTLLGSVLLVTALALALAATAGWTALGTAARHGDPPSARRILPNATLAASVGAATSVALAAALLVAALVADDVSFGYVAKVTETAMPVYYRVTSLWSAMEGSLVLWLLCLSTVAAAFVLVARSSAPWRSFAAAVLHGVVAAFTVVALVASPFAVDAADLGARPNPLLQDHPAMGVHPPLLYAGFALLAAPFALSCGALLARMSDAGWRRAVHSWAVLAWIPLTAGIVLGAWWSYAVLGWGGYWAWDPVENASLMPWLIATALLHLRTRGAANAPPLWTHVLAGTGFLLVLLATFLTRSGVIESIHAFSTSPLGPLIGAILAGAGLGWGLLLALRRPSAAAAGPTPVVSRGAALLLNRAGLVLITAVVLAGSVLPAGIEAVTGDRVSVGAPWYARTLAPIALVLLIAMAVGPLLSHRREPGDAVIRRVRVPLSLAALGVLASAIAVPDPALAAGIGIAVFVVAGGVQTLARRRRRDRRVAGALIGHTGVALAAVAVLAGGLASSVEQTLQVGESVAVGSTTGTLVTVERIDEGRRIVAEARIVLADDGQPVGEALPQLRWYQQHGVLLTAPAVRSEALRDVYVTLLDVDPEAASATVRLAVTPLIGWLWAGAGLAVLGVVVAAWPASRRPTRPGAPGADVRLAEESVR